MSISEANKRRAAALVLGLFALLVLHNVVLAIRNQRRLPHSKYEMADWFHVSPPDIEGMATRAARFTIFGRAAVWYYLGRRLAGAHLTIPDWMGDQRWELERVARVSVTVAGGPLRVSDADAQRFKKSGELRLYQQGSVKRRKVMDMVFINDPKSRRYVVAESADEWTLVVIPEDQFVPFVQSGAAAP